MRRKSENEHIKNSGSLEQVNKKSSNLMTKLEQIKESMSPLSNPQHNESQVQNMLSQNRSRLNKYLPEENHGYDRHEDNSSTYRQSLERRLEKLFKEEKDILKDKYYHHQELNTQSNHQLGRNTSITKMENKIKILEEKYYAMESIPKTENQFIAETLPKISKPILKPISKPTSSPNQQFHHHFNKIQHQIQNLKTEVEELKRNNQFFVKRIEKKEERKKHKIRTKQLLKQILSRLEVMLMNRVKGQEKQQKNPKKESDKKENEKSELLKLLSEVRQFYSKFDKERHELQNKLLRIESSVCKEG